jgi:hypothetical protein
MKENREIIEKLRLLKTIKPEKDWVVLTKEKILGKKTSFIFEFPLKPVLATGLLLFLFATTLYFSFSSLPGDPLYSLKKITERSFATILPEDQRTNFQLELAKKRLEELKILAQKNEIKKLPSAFQEVKEVNSIVAQNLSKSKKIDKKIIETVLDVEKTKQEIEDKILATKIGLENEENPAKITLEILISDLENKTLTPEQKEIFEKVKLNYQQGNFVEALILIQKLNETNQAGS